MAILPEILHARFCDHSGRTGHSAHPALNKKWFAFGGNDVFQLGLEDFEDSNIPTELKSPSKAKLNVAYTLMASTLVSGTILVISSKSALLSACVTGLIYTSIVSVGIFAARHKLNTSNSI